MTWYEQSILTSFICIGLKVCYAPGKIFSFVGSWLLKIFNKGGRWCYIAMPLGACHYCMASVYGILVHVCLVSLGFGVAPAQLPLILLSVIVMNGILYGVLDWLDPHLFDNGPKKKRQKEQFIFRLRTISTPYWDVIEFYLLGIRVYAKRINIQPGHE